MTAKQRKLISITPKPTPASSLASFNLPIKKMLVSCTSRKRSMLTTRGTVILATSQRHLRVVMLSEL